MSIVWFNGKLIDGSLPLDPRDRGFLLGDGVFETIAVLNRAALWLAEHLARMQQAAAELGIAWEEAAIKSALNAVLARSTGAFEVLRISLTRGAATRGLAADGEEPSLLATLTPMPKESLFRSVRLANVNIRRNEFAPSSRLKTLSYVDGVAAARAAVNLGADDALMRNTSGHVACSTIANLFLMSGSELITPSREQGILPGIMRGAMLICAPALGFTPVERPVLPEELLGADAVFLTNSLRFVRIVESLDGSRLRQRPLEPFIQALCKLAEEQCGRDPRLI
jgi:branched-chain amino acid aminotransferase